MTIANWGLYALAAFLEISGCFAFWLWLRGGKPAWVALVGMIMLAGFAWALTRVPLDAAGRIFAAYGGVYIVASLVWLVLIEQQSLTRWDIAGGVLCLAGAATILYGARG